MNKHSDHKHGKVQVIKLSNKQNSTNTFVLSIYYVLNSPIRGSRCNFNVYNFKLFYTLFRHYHKKVK